MKKDLKLLTGPLLKDYLINGLMSSTLFSQINSSETTQLMILSLNAVFNHQESSSFQPLNSSVCQKCTCLEMVTSQHGVRNQKTTSPQPKEEELLLPRTKKIRKAQAMPKLS